MHRNTCRERGGLLVLAALVLLFPAPAASAQDAETLKALRDWHGKVVQPGQVAPENLGQLARERIAAWKLPVDKLEPADRGRLVGLTIHAALAVGDARTALEWLPKLAAEGEEDRDTLMTAWLVSGAAGDAQLTQDTLNKLKAAGVLGEKLVAKRVKRLDMIGRPAPDVEVAADQGAVVKLRKRDGIVLVIDFWQYARRPNRSLAQRVRESWQEYADNPHVAFLGVNSDDPTLLAEAMQFVLDNGYGWPQHYEQRSVDAPLTVRAFGIEKTPRDVVIDADGNVRAVGSVAEVSFKYALRAAVAEAAGKFPALPPKTTAGVAAPVAKPKHPVVKPPAAKKADEPSAVRKDDLPHSDEAKSLLEKARLFVKTGRKTDARRLFNEVIAKYPGTWEAADARERLESL